MDTKLKKFKDTLHDVIEEINPDWFHTCTIRDIAYMEQEDLEVVIRTMITLYGCEYVVHALNDILNSVYSNYHYMATLIYSEKRAGCVYPFLENPETYEIIKGIMIDEYRDYDYAHILSSFVYLGNILVKPIETIKSEYVVDTIVLGEDDFPINEKGHYLYHVD